MLVIIFISLKINNRTPFWYCGVRLGMLIRLFYSIVTLRTTLSTFIM